MPLSAVYPGSFDPITSGHLNVIERASEMFEPFHVLVAFNEDKDYMFTGEQRERIVSRTIEACAFDVDVTLHDGLTDDFIAEHGVDVLIRGLRNGDDLRYEMELEEYFQQTTDAEVVYLTPSSEHLKTSSTVVRRFLKTGHEERAAEYLHPTTFEEIQHIRSAETG